MTWTEEVQVTKEREPTRTGRLTGRLTAAKTEEGKATLAIGNIRLCGDVHVRKEAIDLMCTAMIIACAVDGKALTTNAKIEYDTLKDKTPDRTVVSCGAMTKVLAYTGDTASENAVGIGANTAVVGNADVAYQMTAKGTQHNPRNRR